MKTVAEKIQELKDKESQVKAMGGLKAVEKQHAAGKLTARERLDLFFDPGTFRATDIFVTHRCVNFGMEKIEIPADGVITGFGKVDGRTVFAFAQDFTSRAGSLGEMHSKKICKVMDLALKAGAPFVGFNDSGGARIQEGVDSLSAYGQIFYRNAIASGVIPQISAIMGPTAGGAVYSPAMTDFIFMVKNTSYMFITGPDVIKSVTVEQISKLLAFLHSNNMEDPPLMPCSDPADREEPALDAIVPDSPAASYNMHDVIRAIVDDGDFFEPHRYFAQNIITVLARLGGRPVGIIANQPTVMAGCLDVDSADKACRFIRFCDAFNIPLLTIADVPGYLPGRDQEWRGILRHGAKLLWCYSEATVPKITLVTRKDYGGSYLAMCSRDLGADLVLTWPTAEIAVMGASGAANVIFRKEIKEAADPVAKRAEIIENYETLLYNPYIAASRGFVDQVIAPRQTRPKLIAALSALASKRETL